MKSRLTLIFAALLVLLGAVIWMVQDRHTGAAAPAAAVAARVAPAARQAIAPTTAPAAVASVETPGPQGKSSPMVQVDTSGGAKYVAQAGDTLSQLATALLGSDSKEHRELVIAANPSLQADPDRVLAGQTYSSVRDDKTAVAGSGPQLKYTAQRGDTVSGLASNLLGGDTKANREGIVAGNASLQQDPDHMVAGQNYTIVARKGLAADPGAAPAKVPTTQPEADEAALLGVGRTLRYTAQTGDTVSKLAVVLLGGDTPANRDLIIKSNPSLQRNPDHLTAGQTYWITAPTAD